MTMNIRELVERELYSEADLYSKVLGDPPNPKDFEDREDRPELKKLIIKWNDNIPSGFKKANISSGKMTYSRTILLSSSNKHLLVTRGFNGFEGSYASETFTLQAFLMNKGGIYAVSTNKKFGGKNNKANFNKESDVINKISKDSDILDDPSFTNKDNSQTMSESFKIGKYWFAYLSSFEMEAKQLPIL